MQILNPLHRFHGFLRRGWVPKLGLAYKAAPNVSLFGNVSRLFMPQHSIASHGYTDAKVQEDPDYKGRMLPNVPHRNGSLFLTYAFHNVIGGNTLTVGGGGRCVCR
ncbi:TonB-dependent ferric achromobactin receptor [Erwinia sp. Ejp617]|nr:TonB-dependent ferric achromobactin receptor [Erwinia sp. Ejp617]